LCIADHHARRRKADRWWHPLSSDGLEDTANVGGHSFAVLRTHWNCRHSRVLPAALDDGNNQFAIAIAQRHLRSQQVGPTEIASSQICAVAACATDAVQCFPACDLHGVARRPLLPRNKSPRPTCAPRRCSLCRRVSCAGYNNQNDRCQTLLDPHTLHLEAQQTSIVIASAGENEVSFCGIPCPGNGQAKTPVPSPEGV